MVIVNDAKFLAPVPKTPSEQEKQNSDIVKDGVNKRINDAYAKKHNDDWNEVERRKGDDRRDREKSKRRRFDQRSQTDRRINQGLKVKI